MVRSLAILNTVYFPKCGGFSFEEWWSVWHMKPFSHLIIVGTVCSKPTAAKANEAMIQRFKERQTRSHCAAGAFVCENCCCMPVGIRISDGAPCCLMKNALALQ